MEINGRKFLCNARGDIYECRFREFEIRVVKTAWGRPRFDRVPAYDWAAQQIADGKTYYLTGYWPTPEEAAWQALSVWAADIEESDRADATDADRERREYVRDNQLRKSDVI